MSNLYIRLQTGFWTHPKTLAAKRKIGCDVFWILPRLWCFAVEHAPDGDLSQFKDEDIAELLQYSGNAQAMLESLREVGFLDGMKIVNWSKWEGYHATFHERALKAAKARWTKKQDREKDKDKDMDKDKEQALLKQCLSIPQASRFQKPTLDALKLAMAKAGGTDTDAEAFMNHYEANGWKVGRNPMKSWPHAVGNWVARKREMSPGAGGTTGTVQKLNGGHARPLYVGELKAVLEAQRGKRAEIERRGYEDAFGIQFSKPEDRAEWQGISREIRDTLDKISKAGQ